LGLRLRVDLPSRERLDRLPYLSGVDFSAFDVGEDLPNDMDFAAPDELTIIVSRKGDEFSPDIGEVVPKGVRRDPPYRESWSMTGWPTIVDAPGSAPSARHCHPDDRAMLRQALAELGDLDEDRGCIAFSQAGRQFEVAGVSGASPGLSRARDAAPAGGA
jgi:hypothetical protein